MTEVPPTVAVIGPGAIGGTIAAWLSRASGVASVSVCARTPIDRLEVQVPDGSTITATPQVLIRPADVPAAVDWVLVATKAYDVEAALNGSAR